MSGICGIMARNGAPLDPALLERMLATLAHRGPDGQGSWQDGQAALGQQLLWTTPESKFEQLPLVDKETGLVLCCDARIDNRQELATELGMRQDATMPDSHFILAAFQKWGEECPAHLIGDYAFAIWDSRQHRLFCGRDHLGARPFYYFLSDQLFVFASEIKALLAVAQIRPQLNEPRLADFLQRILDNNRDTFYRDIMRLEPATTLTVEPARVVAQRYWQLDPKRRLPAASNGEYAAEFRELFTEAVRCRLRSAYPIGITLSGGLDSSSVACVARNILAERGQVLHTFSAIFPDLPAEDLKKIDERRYQQAIIDQGGFAHHPFRADQLCPLQNLEQQLRLMDEPFFGPNAYLGDEANRVARANGVRVMLDGLDGDTVISHGYERLQGLVLSGRWPTLVKEILLLADKQGIGQKRLIYLLALRPYLREPLAHIYRLCKSLLRPGWNFQALVKQQYGKRWSLHQRFRPQLDSFRAPASLHQECMTSSLQTSALEMVNCFASAKSITNRSPFYDRRLMEFCLALPDTQKLQQGWTRFILRNGMTGIVPQEVLWRPDKGDLSLGFSRNLLRCHQALLKEVVRQPHPLLGQAINTPTLARAFEQFLANPVANQKNPLDLYCTVVLEKWFRGAEQGDFLPGQSLAK